jgi:hypothetical protein
VTLIPSSHQKTGDPDKKIKTETSELNNATGQMDLTDFNFVGHKASLNKYKKTEIISCILSCIFIPQRNKTRNK